MNKIVATKSFIEKAKEVHGNKYDYSKVEYINNRTKVCIICPKHGEFWQSPSNHIHRKRGCPKCNGGVGITTEEFIKRAINVHGDKYDYSKVNYINANTKVCIICPKHGEFWQTPSLHLNSCGCPKCWEDRKGAAHLSNKDEFIEKAKKIHGDKYDYSKVEYKLSKEKVCITCPKHGEFWQTPNKHLMGRRCPTCSKENKKTRKNDTEWFIEAAKKVHGNKYDYSKVEYKNCNEKVCIICPEHGEFWQKPHNHLNGKGCERCVRYMHDTATFIELAKKTHGDKYDYSKAEYINNSTKVCIICSEHGEFWQTPNNHIRGQGCKHCSISHLERAVGDFLTKNNVEFEAQKKFDWLGRQSIDYYIPKYNVAIECQGKQHFTPVDAFGGEEAFNKTVELDKKKKSLCEEHGIKILYYARGLASYPENIFTSKKKLLKEIKNDIRKN